MNIATDTVVVQFLSNIQGLRKGLVDIRKEAERTQSALQKSSGGTGGELALQRSSLRLEQQRVNTRKSILDLRQRDAAEARKLWVSQRVDIKRFEKASKDALASQDPQQRMMAETALNNAKVEAMRRTETEAKRISADRIRAVREEARAEEKRVSDNVRTQGQWAAGLRRMDTLRATSATKEMAFQRSVTSATEARARMQEQLHALRRRDAGLAERLGQRATQEQQRYQTIIDKSRAQAPENRTRIQTAANNQFARSFGAITREATAAIRSHERETETFEGRYNAMERALGTYSRGFRRMTANLTTGGGIIDRIGIITDRASMAMWKFTIAAMPLRQIGMWLGGIAVGLGALTVSLAKQAAWLEVTRRQFQNMTGSVSLANEKIEWLRDQAPKIVYSLQQVVEAGRILTSAGYDIQSVVYPMADLAAGLNQEGIDIVSATRAFVDGMHGEIRRLKNTFNISQQDIIKFTRATTWETFQQLSVAERQAAILSAIQEKYPAANKAALESILGAWSDFKDKAIQLAQDIGQFLLKPLQGWIDRGRALLEWLRSLPPWMKNVIAQGVLIGSMVAGVLSAVTMLGAGLFQAVGMIQAMQIGWSGLAGKMKLVVDAELLVMQMHSRLARIQAAHAIERAQQHSAEIAALEVELGLLEAQAIAVTNAAGGRAVGTLQAARTAAAASGARLPLIYAENRTMQAAASSAAGGGATAAMSASRLGILPVGGGALTPGFLGAAGVAGVLSGIALEIAAPFIAHSLAINRLTKDTERLADEFQKAASTIRDSTVLEVEPGLDALVDSARRTMDLWTQVSTRKDIGKALIEAGASPAEAAQMIRAMGRELERGGMRGMASDNPLARYLGEKTFREAMPARGVTPGNVESFQWSDRFFGSAVSRAAIRALGDRLFQATGPAAERLNELNEVASRQAKERLAQIDREIDALYQRAQAGDMSAQSELDRLYALRNTYDLIVKSATPADDLARMDRARYSEARKNVLTMDETFDLLDDLEKKDANRHEIASKLRGAYTNGLAALQQMEIVAAQMAEYDDRGKESRAREIAQLREQLQIQRSINSAVEARIRLAEQAPWAGIFGAAGGSKAIAQGMMAGTMMDEARGYWAAAMGTQEPGERQRLENQALEKYEDTLEAVFGYRKEIHELMLKSVDLEDDEATKARLKARELERFAALSQAEWAERENALRRMGVTEEQINVARRAFELEIGTLRKQALDERRRATQLDYDVEAARMQAQAELAEAYRGSRAEAARWEYRIALLKEAQARADANIHNDEVAHLATVRTYHAMILSQQEEELSIAETKLALAEDMAKQEMMNEEQVAAFRRAAAQEALESLRQHERGTLRWWEAYRRYFNLMYDSADKTKDKFKGIVDSIIGVPQELMGRFLSPASMMRVFGGETLAGVIGGLKGVGPRPGAEIQGNITVQILGLPENLVRVVDQKIVIGNQQFARQLIPAMRSA